MITEIDELIEELKYQEALELLLSLDWSLYDEQILLTKASWLYNRLYQYEQAIIQLERLIETGKEDAWVYSEYGHALNGAERYDDAIEALFQAKDLGRNDTWVNCELASCYMNLKFYEEAIEFLNEALDIDENDIWAYSQLGRVHLETNQYEKAVDYYLTAFSLGREDFWIHGELAFLYNRLRQPDKALEHLEHLLEEDGGNDWLYLELFLVYDEKGDLNKALEFLELVEDKESNDYLMKKGYCLNRLDKEEEALEMFLKIEEESIYLSKELASVYIAKEDFDQVVEYLLKAISLGSTGDIWVYYQLGRAYTVLEQYKSAKEYLEKALEIDEKHIAAISQLAWVHRKTEELETAYSLLLKAHEYGRADVWIFYQLARIVTDLNDNYQEAIHWLKKAEELADDDYWVICELAWDYRMNNQSELGKPYIDRLLSRESVDGWVYSEACEYAILSGDFKLALVFILLAEQVGRKDSYVNYKKSILYKELNLPKESFLSLERAIELGRNYKSDKEDKKILKKQIDSICREIKSKSFFASKKRDVVGKYIQLADYSNALSRLEDPSNDKDIERKIWCLYHLHREQVIPYIESVSEDFKNKEWVQYVMILCNKEGDDIG